MKRIAGLSVAVAALIFLAAWSRTEPQPAAPATSEVHIPAEKQNPWNHLKFNSAPGIFRFAIVTDRTGGPRAGGFERSVEQLNILQPEFVVSVGDLIQGGTEDLPKISKQWQEVKGMISKLQMPSYNVAGNHDLSNKLMDQRWNEQFGRSHYHFVYKDVLFLLLNTEDPPKTKTGAISKEQIAFAKKVLAEHAQVRWTLVFLHRPVWAEKETAKTGWLEVEKALTGRTYTVFAGHRHIYKKYQRNGANYYQLATTGGSSKLRGIPFGEFDHLVWVTMKDTGPVLANLMTEGIFAENLAGIGIPETGAKSPPP